MLIEGVGIGSTNYIRARRQWMGTPLTGIATGTLITKVVGNYNIVDNTLNFVEAPYGNTPLGTSTNAPDETIKEYRQVRLSKADRSLEMLLQIQSMKHIIKTMFLMISHQNSMV